MREGEGLGDCYVCLLFKSEVKRTECKNYRGICLQINRIRRMNNRLLDDEQECFIREEMNG